MKQSLMALGLNVSVLLISTPVYAALITDYTAQTQVAIASDIPQFGTVQNGTSQQGTRTWDNGAAFGSIDLTTGQARASISAQAVNDHPVFPVNSVWVEGFEFVEFSFDAIQQTSSIIEYEYAVDGSLFNTDENAQVNAGASVFVYDVTGLEQDDVFVPDSRGQYVSLGVPDIHANAQYYDLLGENAANLFEYDFGRSQEFTDSSGEPIFVDDVLSGSFQVFEDRQYLINLSLSTATLFNDALAGADFSNTAAFTFTDLGGASLASASGTFLSDVPQAHNVPEPTTAAILALGLAGFGALRRQASS